MIKNSALYVLANAINSLMPFILLPILTRYLTSEQYGELAMFTTWTGLVTVFCGVNVNASANRKYFELRDSKNEIAKYIYNCLLVLLTGSIFVLILSLYLAEFISDLININKSFIYAGVVVASFNVLIQLRLGQWQVREKPIQFGIFLILFSITNLLLSIVFVVDLNMQTEGRVLGILASTAAFFLVALFLLRRDDLLSLELSAFYIKDAIRFGAPLIPHLIGVFLLLTIDRAFISNKLGATSAGIYMVAVQFSLAASIILDSINKAFCPWLFNILNENSVKKKKIVVKVTYILYFIIIAGVLISFFVSEFLVGMVVGEGFSNVAELVPFLVLGQGLRGMYLLVTNYIFYARKTATISLITIISGCINVLLLVILIDLYGIFGAAYSFIISMSFQWLATWYFANSYIKMPWLKLG